MQDRYHTQHMNLVSHFIDCNCLPTTVTGGGPTNGGAYAIRWNDDLQRSLYNGWKSVNSWIEASNSG
jgi:hypothetical protein